jgi:hypothetical protein
LQWCGPCKLIYPELVKLSAELAPAATIVKFNCNQNNKELAKALGIKVGCSCCCCCWSFSARAGPSCKGRRLCWMLHTTS